MSSPVSLLTPRFYCSLLKLFTGFARAAFIAWKLTVINVITRAPTHDATNTHADMDVL